MRNVCYGAAGGTTGGVCASNCANAAAADAPTGANAAQSTIAEPATAVDTHNGTSTAKPMQDQFYMHRGRKIAQYNLYEWVQCVSVVPKKEQEEAESLEKAAKATLEQRKRIGELHLRFPRSGTQEGTQAAQGNGGAQVTRKKGKVGPTKTELVGCL